MMGWPQIAVVILLTAGATIGVVKHGEPDTPHDGWASVIGVGIFVGLLYAGGFFYG
jgi:hypothetical protein